MSRFWDENGPTSLFHPKPLLWWECHVAEHEFRQLGLVCGCGCSRVDSVVESVWMGHLLSRGDPKGQGTGADCNFGRPASGSEMQCAATKTKTEHEFVVLKRCRKVEKSSNICANLLSPTSYGWRFLSVTA